MSLIKLDGLMNFLLKNIRLKIFGHSENLWGEGNRVSHHEILNNQQIRNSLYLVKVDKLELFKDQYDKEEQFSYGGIDYNLAVTGREFDDNFETNSTFLSNVIICGLGKTMVIAINWLLQLFLS
jgi:hypothetical protein